MSDGAPAPLRQVSLTEKTKLKKFWFCSGKPCLRGAGAPLDIHLNKYTNGDWTKAGWLSNFLKMTSSRGDIRYKLIKFLLVSRHYNPIKQKTNPLIPILKAE